MRPTGIAIGHDHQLLVADSASSRLHVVTPRDGGGTLVDGGIGPAPDRPLPAAEHRWPVRPQLAWHEVVGTVGQEVLAIAPGKVSNPLAAWAFGKLNEGLAIDSLAYIHMHVGRDAQGRPLDPARFVQVLDEAGKLQRVRVRRGARFDAGDVLGSINPMAHVHPWMGVSGYGINPLLLQLKDFRDTVPPSIAAIEVHVAAGLLLSRREAGRLLVPRGEVSVVLDAWDQVDGNLPRRRLGLYSLAFQWLHADGTPVTGFEQPRSVIEFSRLPDDDLVKTVYADKSGITVQGNAETHFRYAIGRPQDQNGVGSLCATTALPTGDYVLRIVAKDFSGNEATRGRDVAVRVF